MGVLDDAIREHIELKRRHGVAEEELRRQEEEALGPARRDVAHQHEEIELEPDDPATAEPEPSEPTPVESPPVEPPPSEQEDEEDALVAAEANEEAEPYDRDPDDDEMPLADADDEGEGEDVLEDTPDFLQETPEHDRLWFEQKPPRDFDFD
jgi:hypothetical protein